MGRARRSFYNVQRYASRPTFLFLLGTTDGRETKEPLAEDSSDVLGSVRTQETEGGDDSTTAAGVDLEGGANAAPQMSTN